MTLLDWRSGIEQNEGDDLEDRPTTDAAAWSMRAVGIVRRELNGRDRAMECPRAPSDVGGEPSTSSAPDA
jgi:hypothetical protein